MKKSIFLLNFIFFSFSALSQLSAEAKIKNHFGVDWYDREVLENNQWIEILKVYVTEGFKLISIQQGKYNELTPINEVKLNSKSNEAISIQQFINEYESENFNPLQYQFFPTIETQIIKLDGINKVIYIESISNLLNSANE